MPPKNKNRKKGKKTNKRNYKSKYSDNWLSIVRSNQPITDPRKGCKLVLAYKISQTTTTIMARWSFGANCLYDPWFTSGSTTQPRGYDQLSALYEQYRVHAVKVVFDVTGTYSTPVAGEVPSFIIGLHYYHNNTNYPTTIEALLEDRQSKHKVCRGHGKISWYLPISKMFNRSKDVIRTDKIYSAGVGANPSEVPRVNLLMQNTDAVTSTVFDAWATVTFYSEFNSPTYLTSS